MSKARDLSRRGHRSSSAIGDTGGITKSHIGLGNVANVDLSNVTNESKATMFTDPTFTGTVNCDDLNADRTLRSYGHQVWTTKGSGVGDAVYIPYNGGYYTTLFYNSGGYHALTGRLLITVAISQAHQGTYDFCLNNYGSGISNETTGAHNSYISLSTVSYNGNQALRLTNTNGSGWGNGWYYITAIVWGGGENRFNTLSAGDDDNFTSSQSGTFFTRVV